MSTVTVDQICESQNTWIQKPNQNIMEIELIYGINILESNNIHIKMMVRSPLE